MNNHMIQSLNKELGLTTFAGWIRKGGFTVADDRLAAWKKAGELTVANQNASNFRRLLGLAKRAKRSLALRGLLLLGSAKGRGFNDLIASQDRLLGLDLLSADLYSNKFSPYLGQVLFETLLGMADLNAASNVLDEFEEGFSVSGKLGIFQSRLSAAMHDFESALRFAQDAASDWPNSVAAIVRLSQAHGAVSDFESAIHVLEEGIQRHPRNQTLASAKNRLQADIEAFRCFPPERFDSTLMEYVNLSVTGDDLEYLLDKHPRANYFLHAPETDFALIAKGLASRAQLPGGSFYWFGGTTSPDANLSWFLIPRRSLEIFANSKRTDGLVADEIVRSFYRGARVYLHDRRGQSTLQIAARREDNQAGEVTITGAAHDLLIKEASSKDRKLQSSEHHKVLVATPSDWEAIRPAVTSRDIDLIMLIPPGYSSSKDTSVPVRQVQEWLPYASSIVSTSVTEVEWFEDEFHVGMNVYRSYSAGLGKALASLTLRVCIAVGSGIGNMLAATALIRVVSEQVGHPIDVIFNSGIPSAEALFAESRFVNLAHSYEQPRLCRFDKVFVTSSFGSELLGIRAVEVTRQRQKFDFYTETKKVNEAEYCFYGIKDLLPEIEVPSSLAGLAFVRSFDSNRSIAKRPKKRVGIGAPSKSGLWANREWGGYPTLVRHLSASGFEVHSFGPHSDYVHGTVNSTSDSLRESIRLMAECDFFVCSDGGLLHIVDALGARAIGIFGPTSSVKNGPLNSTISIISSSIGCSPCQFHEGFTSCATPACMRDISPETVVSSLVATHLDAKQASLHTPQISPPRSETSSYTFEKEEFHAYCENAQLELGELRSLAQASFRLGRTERATMLLDKVFSSGSPIPSDWALKALFERDQGRSAMSDLIESYSLEINTKRK